ncbi:m7GpppX diphosphatase-like [Varroa jacobsoni]|uniref:m7GpppX diphosphatase-like n=1 Tax=Varroa jacobsoni TaxID=62625 RepID=UPI000BF3762E|nr:m7GpppX diphosphatase-like [Varroa jacobsoni]
MASGDVKAQKPCDFGKFQFKRILNDNPQSKISFVEGKFEGNEDAAVVILEKTPFSEEMCTKILKTQEGPEKDAIPEEIFRNDIYSGYLLRPERSLNEIKVTVIYPATEKHIEKYSRQELLLVTETAQLYKERVEPYLKDNCFSVQWVYNILEHKAEQESVLYEDFSEQVGFMLIRDMKWDMKQNEDLHCLIMVHDRKLRSLRDLRARHLPMLRNIRSKVFIYTKEKFDMGEDKLMLYFHYQPSYYHMHIHVVAITVENPPGGGCHRGHLLDVVISNLEICDNYYERATLCYTLKKNSPLAKIIFEQPEGDIDNKKEVNDANTL